MLKNIPNGKNSYYIVFYLNIYYSLNLNIFKISILGIQYFPDLGNQNSTKIWVIGVYFLNLGNI